MKLMEQRPLESAVGTVGLPTREDVRERVRRFATLRAAQRALAPSSREPIDPADTEAVRWIREQLAELIRRFEPDEPGWYRSSQRRPAPEVREEEIVDLDRALDAYAKVLLCRLEPLSVPQLRSSLGSDSEPQRTEAMALLELCIESEVVPDRFLHVVDLLVTQLCSVQIDGVWMLATDPANLSETVRQRCWSAGGCGAGTEAGIAHRFQQAAQSLSEGNDVAKVLAETWAYKQQLAGLFFVPSVLRCIVGYNVCARNVFEDRQDRSREADRAIDADLGHFLSEAEGTEETAAGLPEEGIRPHEAPGVVAVQEAIQRRLLDADPEPGPAARIAASLDLSWLEPYEREALLHPERDGTSEIVRMSVLLGHLAMAADSQPADFKILCLHEAQLDAWICALGEQAQHEINSLIRDDFDGAQQLGSTKSRFLQAVLFVARRRHDPRRKRWTGSEERDDFERSAIELVRACLERQALLGRPKPFLDLLGGGWRRTAAFAVVGLLLGRVGILQIEPAPPRAVHEFSAPAAHEVSPLLAGAYRDYARQGSMFVAIVDPEWFELEPLQQRREAEDIRYSLTEKGVEEILLFDPQRVLLVHYQDGRWRTPQDWAR